MDLGKIVVVEKETGQVIGELSRERMKKDINDLYEIPEKK